MPPRPLHRWKSFWLGVFVVVFLAWAWGRSGQFAEKAVFGNPSVTGFVDLGQTDGILFLTVFRVPNEVSLVCYSPIAGDLGNPVSAWRDPHGIRRQFSFPAAVDVDLESKWSSIAIAHWFLILLFLLPWTAWLVGRSRRMKRLD